MGRQAAVLPGWEPHLGCGWKGGVRTGLHVSFNAVHRSVHIDSREHVRGLWEDGGWGHGASSLQLAPCGGEWDSGVLQVRCSLLTHHSLPHGMLSFVYFGVLFIREIIGVSLLHKNTGFCLVRYL